MPADYSRVHRLLRIITLVQGGGTWTPESLADACGVKPRSIFRDIKCIEQAGIPLAFDHKLKRYTIDGEHYLPPTQLSMEESLAVIALAEEVSRTEQVPHLQAALSAAQKLRSQLPPRVREHLSKTDGRVTIKLAAAEPPGQETSAFHRVRNAIANRFVLDVTYDSPPPGPSSHPADPAGSTAKRGPFKLCPYELVFEQRAWYVIGHSSRHNAVRTFKLSRFTRLIVMDTQFEAPKTWSLDKFRGNAWRMIRGPRRHTVEILIDPPFSETIGETQWHKTQQSEELEDGRLRLRFEIDGLDEVVWWVLSLGPNAKVLSPPDLAEKVKQLAESTAALYRPTPPTPSPRAQRIPIPT